MVNGVANVLRYSFLKHLMNIVRSSHSNDHCRPMNGLLGSNEVQSLCAPKSKIVSLKVQPRKSRNGCLKLSSIQHISVVLPRIESDLDYGPYGLKTITLRVAASTFYTFSLFYKIAIDAFGLPRETRY